MNTNNIWGNYQLGSSRGAKIFKRFDPAVLIVILVTSVTSVVKGFGCDSVMT